MADLINDDFRALYQDTIELVLAHGRHTAPRGHFTLELPAATLQLTGLRSGRAALPLGVGRKAHPGIGAVEALQLIAGEQYPELMRRIAPNFGRFMDGGAFHGAYGERLRGQLEAATRRLKDDASSRQAILQIWDPARDLHVEGLRDYPCTIFLQVLLRNDALELHAHMRSNDVWWGLAYDAFQFTQLQHTLANVMGVDVGDYFHHAASLHLYERDFEAAQLVLREWPIEGELPVVDGIRGQDLGMVRHRAREALRGRLAAPADRGLKWLHAQVDRYQP